MLRGPQNTYYKDSQKGAPNFRKPQIWETSRRKNGVRSMTDVLELLQGHLGQVSASLSNTWVAVMRSLVEVTMRIRIMTTVIFLM